MSLRKRRRMPPDAEPWLRYLPADLRDNPKSVAWAKAKHEHEEKLRAFHRCLVDFYAFHAVCPHAGCRRARRCVQPDLPCFAAALPALREEVFPWLRAALLRRQAEAAVRPESPL